MKLIDQLSHLRHRALQWLRLEPAVRRPEDYWVGRGARVVGRGGLDELIDGRQVDTFRAIADVIEQTRASRVIDLGCNVGALGQLLFHWGFAGEYIGVENNGHALEVARRHLAPWRARTRLVNANIRALPFAGRAGAQAVVVMKDVLEHAEDFRPLLGEAARVAGEHLLIASFIPWTDGAPEIRRDRRGFYLNRYRRADVLAEAERLGLRLAGSTATREKDGRPNEVVHLRRPA